MKIGLLTHQYPGTRGGGIGTYVVEVARALARESHEVHVFTFGLPAGVVRPAGVQVHEVADVAERVSAGTLPAELEELVATGGEGEYRVALGWLLCEAAREFHRAGGGKGLDVVEGPEYEALGLPLMVRPEEGLVVVTHLHLCSAVAREGNVGGETRNAKRETRNDKHVHLAESEKFIDGLEAAAVGLADGVCAPTGNIVELTRRIAGVGGEAVVIPHPMAVPGGGGACEAVPDDGAVLFVGRLEPRKGTGLMAEAFNRFLSRNPRAVVRLVGTDTQWGGGSVQARIVAGLEEGVKERVVFVGEKSPEEVRREFAACRFSICPSLMESFGYVAAESMIAGRAVVVSSGIGATEVVGDGGVVFECGNAAALAEAMERLWRDRALCAELGKRAFARAREIFAVERTVAGRVAFYQAAVEALRSRPRVGVAERLAALGRSQTTAWLLGLAGLEPMPVGKAGANTPGARLLKVMEGIGGGGAASVMLYGAGRYTARLLTQRRLWEVKGHRVVGLIDDHARFAGGGRHLGLPVCSCAVVEARTRGGERIPAVVLSTDTFEEQFWKQTAGLREMGVTVHRLYG